MLGSVAKGIALFFGIFTLLNFAGDLRFAGPSGNVWWIDVTPLPAWVLVPVALVFVVFGVAQAFRTAPPSRPERRLESLRHMAAFAVVPVYIAAAANAARYYRLLAHGTIRSSFPVPLSLFILAAMAILAMALVRKPEEGRMRDVVIAAIVCAVIFPLAQIATFGLTDYRRPADLIVVFGAKAYPGGRLSPALEDRVDTGIELYRAGLAPRLLFSGGPNEPEAMRRFAIAHGVPASAIVNDPNGVNTESTARNTMALARVPRILAVSHFYHLPRVKMTYQRYGANVFTVPSRNDAPGMLFNLTRETAAFWRYYLRRV